MRALLRLGLASGRRERAVVRNTAIRGCWHRNRRAHRNWFVATLAHQPAVRTRLRETRRAGAATDEGPICDFRGRCTARIRAAAWLRPFPSSANCIGILGVPRRTCESACQSVCIVRAAGGVGPGSRGGRGRRRTRARLAREILRLQLRIHAGEMRRRRSVPHQAASGAPGSVRDRTPLRTCAPDDGAIQVYPLAVRIGDA